MVPTSFAPRLLVAAVALAAAPVRADDPPGARADVSTLLADPARLAQRLRDLDPTVAAARAKVIAAQAGGRQARVLPNPELTAGVGDIVVGRANHYQGQVGPTGFAETANVSVGVSELIELGKRAPRRSAADARTRQASEEAVAALGTRVGDAIETLGKLAYVSARRDVVAANLTDAQKLQALEKVRLDHQDLAPVEFARIDLDTRALAVQLRRAESDVSAALADCTTVLQQACTAEGLGAGALDAGAPLPVPLPEPSAAIAARPERLASRAEAQAYGLDAILAERRRIPDPTVGVNYTYDTYQYSGSAPSTLMLSVGIPLPLFDRGTHDAAAARASAKAVEAEDAAAVREAQGQVGSLLARRDSLVETLAQLETESVPQSTQIIEQTRRAFDLGQARLADLLLVERAHRDLLLDVLDTRFELFGVRGQLRQVLGIDDDIARRTP